MTSLSNTTPRSAASCSGAFVLSTKYQLPVERPCASGRFVAGSSAPSNATSQPHVRQVTERW